MTITNSNHPQYYLYTAWYNAVARCHKEDHPHYKDYGARGIHVFNEWRYSHVSFIKYILETLGERPSVNHSLDRILNDKGYEPGNLKWSTRSEQNSNTRNSPAHKHIYPYRNNWRVVVNGKYHGSRRSIDESIILRDSIGTA